MKQARQQTILHMLAQHQSLTTKALAAMVDVSIETLRRDIRELHQQGKIVRQHGKVNYVADDDSDNGLSFVERFRRHARNKKEVVAQVLTHIAAEMCIALDASSTCWYLSKQLPNIPLTVITNSFRICCELEKKDQITVICTGGMLVRKYSSFFISSDSLALIKSRQIDLFIFSCDSVDRLGNVWDTNNGNAKFKKYVFGHAQKKVLLIDKSKIGSRGELNLFNLNDITSLIYR